MSKSLYLSQIISLDKTIKSRVHSTTSEQYKLLQKPALFNGFHREYKPLDDNDKEVFPAEKQKVQYTVKGVLKDTRKSLTELFNISSKREWTNTTAFGNIVVDGVILVEKAPVGMLLFLEKQLIDLKDMIAKMPILDQADSWTLDDKTNMYRTDVTKTHKTKKMPRVIVKYDATEHHPAQTEIFNEDLIVGHWNASKFSGAMPLTTYNEMVEKIEKLINAVKIAREEANSTKEFPNIPDVAAKLFDFVGI